MCRSVPQIAVFSSLISTSLAPGTGTGTCSIQMPLVASRLTSAFIIRPIAVPVASWKEGAIIRPAPGPAGGCSRRFRPSMALDAVMAAGSMSRIHSGLSLFRTPYMYRRPLTIAFTIAAAAAGAVHAAEGMWVPQQLPEIAASLKKAGLRLDPQQLADLTGDPLGAVVSLGGCTASFVSPKGLVATNHHCAYGAIQLNSTPDNNLMRDGFNAPSTSDEITAGPNARIFVLDSIEDVSERVRSAIAAADHAL